MAKLAEPQIPIFLAKEDDHPLQELLPWMTYLADGVILNKDGSLLAGYEYSGLDPDNIDDELVNRAVEELERAINANFDERVTLWIVTKRRKAYRYINQTFTNEVARRVDEAYAKPYRNGSFYEMSRWFFVLFTGNTGVDGLMDRVRHIEAEEQVAGPVAYMKALNGSVSTSAGLARDRRQLEMNWKAFEQILGSFVGSTPALSFKRMKSDQFDNALFQLANPASEYDVLERPDDVMLDSWIPADSVVVGSDVIRFTGNHGDRYAAVFGAKQWPKRVHPMMLENLLRSDNELVVTQTVRCLGKEASEKELTEVRNFLKMTQYSVFATVMSKMTGRKAEAAPGKAELVEEADQALSRLTGGGPNSAYYNLSVMVFDRDRESLERRCANVARLFSLKRLLTIRERENLGPTYAAMLPGNWQWQARFHLVGVDNVVDLAPIYTMDAGPRIHAHFSEVVKKRMPPHAMFIDTYGCQYTWVPHVGQVGHAILIAPTESGKTTFVNFCLSQFQKYGDVNTFIFDRDASVKITTYLHGGKYLDYKGGTLKLNPFALDDGTEFSRVWVREFIMRMLELSGYVLQPADREEIDRILGVMYDEHFVSSRTISTFHSLCPERMAQAIGEWLHGQPYGIFDNEENEFALEAWTAIEMKELAAIPRLFELFMEYAFRTIDMALDGRPTFIYLEEASFLLQIETFAKKIGDWLKTFRKKNAFVWLTVQSPGSINGPVREDLIDNIKTTILMYNNKVESHREFYRKNFGMNDTQINRVGRLRPRLEYMFVQDNFTRVVQTTFSPDVLNYLRSEKHLQTVFNRHKATERTNPNWLDDYLAEAATMKRIDYDREPEESAER